MLTRAEMLRRMGLTVGGVALGGALWGCTSSNPGGSGEDSAGQMVIVDAGGEFGESLKRNFYDPFSEDTGNNVQQVTAISELFAKVKAMSRSGQMEWDVVSVDEILLYSQEKYLQKLDYSRIPNAKAKGIEGTVEPNGLLRNLAPLLLTYNTELLEGDERPQNWADFWDTEKFPGPRSLPNYGAPWWPILAALLADGVPKEELLPLDLDRAFAKLDEIKPEVSVWWEAGDQSQRILRDGEVVMNLAWTGRILNLLETDAPVGFTMNQAFWSAAYWGLLKGAPHEDVAYDYLNFFMTRPEAHAAFAQEIHYLTPNRKALDLLQGKTAEIYSKQSLASTVRIDIRQVAQRVDELIERWNSWLSA